MTIDPTVLPGESGGSVRAVLFEDLIVTLDLGPATRNRDGSRVWTGHVVGEPMSSVTLVNYQDVLCGSVTCSRGAYELDWKEGNLVQVNERDPRTRGHCGSIGHNPYASQGVFPKEAPVTQSALTTIDLYVVYNQPVIDKLGSAAAVQAKIIEQVALSNTAFSNSNADVRLNLVGSDLVVYTQADAKSVKSADLNALTSGSSFAAVRSKRNQLGIDLYQMLITIQPDVGMFTLFGLGWAPDQAKPLGLDQSYSVASLEGYIDGVMVHEIGHNFGCQHDSAQNPAPPSQALYPFAYGYRKPGVFATVMAYPQGNEVHIPVFSNPSIAVSGDPTGVAGINENWKALNLSAPTVAAYAASVNPSPSPNPGGTVTVSLNAGWNAVGLQRQMITTINGTNVAGIAFFDGAYQTQSLAPDAINEGDGGRRGMFVFATAAGQLSYTGADDGKGFFINLKSGWNLCSTANPTNIPGSSLIAKQGGVQVPIGSVMLTQLTEIQPNNTYQTVDIAAGGSLKPGRAYWVFSLGTVQLTTAVTTPSPTPTVTPTPPPSPSPSPTAGLLILNTINAETVVGGNVAITGTINGTTQFITLTVGNSLVASVSGSNTTSPVLRGVSVGSTSFTANGGGQTVQGNVTVK